MNQAFILLANMAKNHVMYEKASRQFKLKGIIQGKLELAEYKIGSSCDLIADKERKFLKKTNQKLRENISVMLVNNEISRAFKNIDTFSREHHNAKRLPCIKTEIGE